MKIILFLLFVFPFVTACGMFQKAKLDDEVRRLCAIDGGIKVYETAKLPADRFEKDGSIYIPPKQRAKPEGGYYYESSRPYLKKEIRKCGSPTISYIEYLNLGDERWESVTSVL